MWWILIGFIVFITYMLIVDGGKLKKEEDELKKSGIVKVGAINNVEYFGGFDDLGYGKCVVEVFEDKMNINIYTGNGGKRSVDFKNVEEIKAISQTEIKEVPSLSKILLLGGFGLLGKGKEKYTAVDYVAIHGKNDKFNILLKPSDRPQFMGMVNSTFRRFKNKEQA